jgi:predicted metalloprotease
VFGVPPDALWRALPTLDPVPRRTRVPFAVSIAAAVFVLAACAVDTGVVATRAAPSGVEEQATAPVDTDPDATTPETDTTDAPPTTLLPPVTAPPSTFDPTPGEAPEIGEVVDVGSSKTPREYDDFVAAALADLQQWWSETYPAVYGEPFEPLAGGVIAAYPTRSEPIPGCGEAETRYPEVNEFSAFYCPLGDFMVYDDGDDSLLGALTGEFGPSVMGVVLAHEFGHAIQNRIGVLDRQLPTIITEQQADCFAGAWVAHAASGESPTIRLSDADVRSGLIAMVTVRDPVGLDQRTEGGHGSAFDRVGAFQEGFTGGAARCAELIDEPLPLMPNTFQSEVDVLTEGDADFGFDGDSIGPIAVGALESYWSYVLGELGLTAPSLTLEPVGDLDAADEQCDDDRRPFEVGVVVCRSDDTVFVDEGFARRMYDDPLEGRADFAVGYLIGTGWADRMQDVLGTDLSGEARALANDCFVGSWALDMMPRALRPGEEDNRGIISPGDLDEAVLAAISLGDPGFDDDRIGSAFEKIDSFRQGVLGGLDRCLERIGG